MPETEEVVCHNCPHGVTGEAPAFPLPNPPRPDAINSQGERLFQGSSRELSLLRALLNGLILKIVIIFTINILKENKLLGF